MRAWGWCGLKRETEKGNGGSSHEGFFLLEKTRVPDPARQSACLPRVLCRSISRVGGISRHIFKPGFKNPNVLQHIHVLMTFSGSRPLQDLSSRAWNSDRREGAGPCMCFYIWHFSTLIQIIGMHV